MSPVDACVWEVSLRYWYSPLSCIQLQQPVGVGSKHGDWKITVHQLYQFRLNTVEMKAILVSLSPTNDVLYFVRFSWYRRRGERGLIRYVSRKFNPKYISNVRLIKTGSDEAGSKSRTHARTHARMHARTHTWRHTTKHQKQKQKTITKE